MRLEETTVIVTGASSGLGKAMASAFVAEGAQVACASRSLERLEAAIDDMDVSGGGDAAPIPTDVRSWNDVRELVRSTRERYGDVDVVVNNAALTQYMVNEDLTRKPIVDVPVDSWEAILRTNLDGVFLCTKAALPEMLSRDDGRFIHVSSGHGVSGRANRSPYVASKFGVEGFHESLALELEDTGVDSLTLRPPGGGVYTEAAVERGGRSADSFTHQDPGVIAEAAVRLAAGEGENGGRYQATADGEGYTTYSRDRD